MVILNGIALRRMEASLLETELHPSTVYLMFLCTRKPTPNLRWFYSPLKYSVCPSICVCVLFSTEVQCVSFYLCLCFILH